MSEQREKELGYCEEAATYCSFAEERYKQGRADAIDYLVSNGYIKYGFDADYLAEQLKEQNDE